MSVIAYANDNKTGNNLSLATLVLLGIAANTPLAYADEIFSPVEFPYVAEKVSPKLDFYSAQSAITEYNTFENTDDINEEFIINLRMPPINSYKRKVKVAKKVHAIPKITLTEFI